MKDGRSPGWVRSRAAVTLGLGVAVFALLAGARELGWWVDWELGAYDTLLRARPPLGGAKPVAMVWVHEEDITRYGYPLPDRVLAEALTAILRHRPRAVGVDIYRDRPTGEGWDELEALFLAHPNLVAVEKLPDANHPAVPPPPFLSDRSQVGFSDVAPDPDGVTRRALLMLWNEEGQPYFSLALRLGLRYLHAEGLGMTPDPDLPEIVRVGPTPVPPFEPDVGGYRHADAGGYQMLLDYRRANGSFAAYRFDEVMRGEVPPEALRDRVVLVGTASPSVKDYFQTPAGFLPTRDALIYGAEHHAHVVDQLVRYARGQGRPLRAWSEPVERAWLLLWCMIGAALALRVGSLASYAAFALLGSAGLVAAAYAAFVAGLWVPLVPALMGGLAALSFSVAYGVQQERAEKLRAMGLFSRFVSRKLFDDIWPQRERFMEGDRPRPQRITVTVMLSDLIGYTSRAEKREPAEVMEWIGVYMDRMARIVEQHDGMINDFLGDGLMASFGVPVASTQQEEICRDARNAVECALAMDRALEELNREWAARGEPTARMRIGILTGPAVVGAIGSAERMKYATVGNTVNTASRLESFDKGTFELEPEQRTTRILVGQSTLEQLGDGYQSVCLGDHALKGKGEEVTIHRVLGRRAEPG